VWAKGLLCLEAAVELLIGNRSWLFREDFLEIAVEFGWEVFSGQLLAAVDFVAAAGALEAGVLPCSGGEGRVLRIAAGIAGGVPVDMREAVTLPPGSNHVPRFSVSSCVGYYGSAAGVVQSGRGVEAGSVRQELSTAGAMCGST
jgi:hypothetical protein